MKNEKMFTEVAELLANVAECKVSDIKPDTKLSDELGITSLMALEVLVELEKKYGIKIEEEKLLDMTTPSKIVDILEEYLKEQKTES